VTWLLAGGLLALAAVIHLAVQAVLAAGGSGRGDDQD